MANTAAPMPHAFGRLVKVFPDDARTGVAAGAAVNVVVTAGTLTIGASVSLGHTQSQLQSPAVALDQRLAARSAAAR